MDILNCSTADRSAEGVKMTLKHPSTGDVLTHQEGDDPSVLKEMYLVILGPESKKVRKALSQINARLNKKNDRHTPSDEEIDNEAITDCKLLASITVGGEVFMGGKWVSIDEKNAFDMYYQVMPFRGQVSNFAFDMGNFTKG